MASAKSSSCYPVNCDHHRHPGHGWKGSVEKEVGEMDSFADHIMTVLDHAEEGPGRERREREVDKYIRLKDKVSNKATNLAKAILWPPDVKS